MKYPKLPNGPSSDGSAAVRALQTTDNVFQTRRGAGYVARLKDDFSRVEVFGGPLYTAVGHVDGGEAVKVYQANDYHQKFTPSHLAYGQSADFGFAFNHVLNSTSSSFVNGTYAVPNPDPAFPDAEFVVPFIKHQTEWSLNIGRADAADAPKATFTAYAQMRYRASTPIFVTYNLVTDVCYIGRVRKADKADIGTAFATLTPGVRVDSGARAMLDLTLNRVYRDAAPESGKPTMPFGNREYHPPRAIASSSCIYLIVFEWINAAWLGARDLSRDYRPPVWLMFSTDGGDSWGFKDIHPEVMGGCGLLYQQVGHYIAASPGAPPWNPGPGFYGVASIPLADDGKATIDDTINYSYMSIAITRRDLDSDGDLDSDEFPFAVNPFYPEGPESGYKYTHASATAAALMRMAMVGDDAFVMAFPYQRGENTALDLFWMFRVVKVSGQGATVETLFTSPEEPGSPFYFFQSMVFTGKNTLVAKKVSNFGEILDAPVTFTHSLDGGVTWTDTTPTGLPSALENQYYGNLFVDRVASDTKPGVLLMPCYDTAKGVYAVYSTSDNGATWKRRGQIAETSTFARVDTMLANDTEHGGNFEDLTPVGSFPPVQPIDRALPKRYSRTAT